jgi:hypothetical protein
MLYKVNQNNTYKIMSFVAVTRDNISKKNTSATTITNVTDH